MSADIQQYHGGLDPNDLQICEALQGIINTTLPEAESKVWHGHPVWFLDGNPVVGYHRLKKGLRLLFWSGQSFDEEKLKPEGKFKAAEYYYHSIDDIEEEDLVRWLQKARDIQWDYKNIVKCRGVLERIA